MEPLLRMARFSLKWIILGLLVTRISALRVLRTSVQSGFFSYTYIAKDPQLNDLHNEREFNEILNTT